MLAKCCCCIPLRTGCIIHSILGIFGGLSFLGDGFNWENAIFSIIYCATHAFLIFGAIKYNQISIVVGLVGECICVLLSILLGVLVFVGGDLTKIMTGCEKAMKNTGIDSSLANYFCDEKLLAKNIIASTIYFFHGLASLYFCFCNYSLYKEFKNSNYQAVKSFVEATHQISYC